MIILNTVLRACRGKHPIIKIRHATYLAHLLIMGSAQETKSVMIVTIIRVIKYNDLIISLIRKS